MRLLVVVALGALIACDRSLPTGTQSQALTADCTVPGATPDDGLDDRAAIKAACAVQHCAYLEPGTYDIDTPIAIAPARRPYMSIDATGCDLRGAITTTLAFRGDNHGGDWQGVRLGGDGSKLLDLTVDTSAIINTDEQTHAIHVLGPANGVEIGRVHINHPARSTTGGDCVQLVGYDDGRLITDAWIHDVDFDHCDRSGVAWHSGQIGLLIEDSRFPDTGDQDLDGEGTGGNTGITVRRNVFGLSPVAQSQHAIEIQLATDVHIVDNVFAGRGMFFYGCSNCEVGRNAITRTVAGSSAAIEVSKASSGVTVHENRVARMASAGPGSVINVAPHGSGTPDHVTVADSELVQHANGNVVTASGIVGLYLQRNTVTYDGHVAAYGLIANGSSGTYAIRTDDIRVEGCTWTGPLKGVIGVSGSIKYAGCGSVMASDNVATGTFGSLVCDSVNTGSRVLGPVISAHNSWPPINCGPVGFVLVTP